MERRCAKYTGERKPCLWNKPFTVLRDLSLSLSPTPTVMKTGAAEERGRDTQLSDCLCGLMESVITDSQCPEADGNKLSRNHLWMRGQGERSAWFLFHGSLGANRNRKSRTEYFPKSQLIYLVSSVHLFSKQTKRNCHLTVQPLMYLWCGALGQIQRADSNQAKVTALWNAWDPRASGETFRHAPLKIKILQGTRFSIPVEPNRYFPNTEAPRDPLQRWQEEKWSKIY